MDSPVQHDFVVVSDLIAPVILEHQKVMSYLLIAVRTLEEHKDIFCTTPAVLELSSKICYVRHLHTYVIC